MLKLIRMFLILLIIYQIHLFLINGESIVSPSGLLCVLQESNNNLCESNDILQSVDGKIECSVNYGMIWYLYHIKINIYTKYFEIYTIKIQKVAVHVNYLNVYHGLS